MGFRVVRQVSVSPNYKGLHFDEDCRAEFIIEDRVITEFKSVENSLSRKKTSNLSTPCWKEAQKLTQFWRGGDEGGYHTLRERTSQTNLGSLLTPLR